MLLEIPIQDDWVKINKYFSGSRMLTGSLRGSQQQHECEKRNTLESRSSLTCKHILVVELAKSVFRSAQKQGLLRQTEQHLFNVKKEQNRFDAIFKSIYISEEEYIQMIVDME